MRLGRLEASVDLLGNDFHCLLSSGVHVAGRPPELWPAGFPRFDASWISSNCGRLAFRVGDHRGDGSWECGEFSGALGEAPFHDLSVKFEQGRLTVERGHVGRVGLFYFRTPSLLLLTSNLRDLIASVECRLNYGSALNYLSFGIPLSGHTLIDGVCALPSGHSLTLNAGALPTRHRTFEILAESDPALPDDEEVADIADAVDEAITRCSGDGNAALLLSAGVDSSYMAALLKDRIRTCYTSDFPDLDYRGEFEEARRLSLLTGHRHVRVPIEIGSARSGLERILCSEEPKSAWSTIVHDILCGVIEDGGHRRLLTGLGADELFGGYFHYVLSFRELSKSALRLDPTGVRNPLELVLGSPDWYRQNLFTGIPLFFDGAALRKALLSPWRRWDPFQSSVHFYVDALSRKPGLHLFEAMVAHESQHRVPDLLVRGFESFSRARKLTTAYPFLDPTVMRKAAALGAAARFAIDPSDNSTVNKIIWRRIARRRLPDFVMSRKPTTYDAPIRDWCADPKFLSVIIDTISLRSLLDLNLFSVSWLRSFIDDLWQMRDRDHVPVDRAILAQAWALATFSAWQDRAIDAR